MVVSKRIADIKATTDKQPPGYVDYLLSRGKIEGDVLMLDDAAQDEIRDKYPFPGQSGVFSVAMLRAGAAYQPAGYAEFILSRGKIRGDIVILTNGLLGELGAKFPPRTRAQVHNLADLIRNSLHRPQAMIEFMLKQGKIQGEFLILEPAVVQELNARLDGALTVTHNIAQLLDNAHQRPEGLADYILAHAELVDGEARLPGRLVPVVQRMFPGNEKEVKHTRADLEAEAARRPKGYLEYALARGRIEGNMVILNGNALTDLNRKFPSEIKYHLAQLQASAARRPKGLIEHVLTHGRIEGEYVILDSGTAQKYKEKFPEAFIPPPNEPTLTEMAANFSGAMAGWAKVGFKTVERAVYEKRLGVCNTCEHWDAQARGGMGKCKICGCSKFKFWLASSVCPDKPPRW